jgi:hypothetical protein
LPVVLDRDEREDEEVLDAEIEALPELDEDAELLALLDVAVEDEVPVELEAATLAAADDAEPDEPLPAVEPRAVDEDAAPAEIPPLDEEVPEMLEAVVEGLSAVAAWHPRALRVANKGKAQRIEGRGRMVAQPSQFHLLRLVAVCHEPSRASVGVLSGRSSGSSGWAPGLASPGRG